MGKPVSLNRRPMLEGLYTAAAGMAAQQQRMDSLANDVANVNTAGYKHVRTGFRDLVYAPAGPRRRRQRHRPAPAPPPRPSAATSRRARCARPASRSTSPSRARASCRSARRRASSRLTRDGSLRVTNTGQLVTSTGAQIVPPINFPAGTNLATGRDRPRRHDQRRQPGDRPARRPSTSASPQALTSVGDNLFVANAQSGAPRSRSPPPSPAATSRPRTSSSPTRWST